MTAYRPTLRVRVRHDFYADTKCPDFEYEPVGATSESLDWNRLFVRRLPDGFDLISRRDATTLQPIVSLDLPAQFTFGMRLKNPSFLQYTDLAPLADLRCFESDGTTEELKPKEWTQERGPAEAGHFGLILLTIRAEDGPIEADKPRSYRITFKSGEQKVRYRVEVRGKEYAGQNFEIKDETDNGTPMVFDAVVDETGLPDKKIWHFESRQALAFREEPRRIFALWRKPGGNSEGDEVSEALPLPSANNPGQEIKVIVNNPSQSPATTPT